MKITYMLVTYFILLFASSLQARECGGQLGAKHLNPGDEVGKPTGGFVGHSAKVDAGVYLGPFVEVCDRAEVLGFDGVFPRIEGVVEIYGRAIVFGNVLIKDRVKIYGGAMVQAGSREQILIREDVQLYGNARVYNNARIQGEAKIYGRGKVQGNGRVCKKNVLTGEALVRDRFTYCPIPDAKLIVYENESLYGPEIIIKADALLSTSQNRNDKLTYVWDFGDFEFSNSNDQVEVEHFYRETGDYLVTLKVYDQNGEYDTEELLITIKEPFNKPPYASIKQDFYSTTKNSLHVKFDASQSVDEDGYVVSYEWDFGNGQTSEEINPEMTFLGPGIYFPRLKVTDDQGSSHTSESVVEVNCTIDEGDNTCPYFVGYTDHILPMSNHQLQIAFGQNGFTIPETIENMTLTLTNDLSSVEHDAVSALEVDNGRLYLNTDKVKTLLTDFNNGYSMNIKLYSAEGDFYSGMLNSIYFAGSTIKGTTPARVGALILVEHVELGFSVRTKVRSDKSFAINDLPFGQYNVTLIDGPISTFESFLLPSLATANLYLYPVDETVGRSTLNTISISNKEKVGKKINLKDHYLPEYKNKSNLVFLDKNTNSSNFNAEKILFSPKDAGGAKGLYSEKIVTNAKKLYLAYQLYVFSKIRSDTFAIRITGPDGPIAIVNVTVADLIESNPNSDLGDNFISSNWIMKEFDLPNNIEGDVLVDLVAVNVGDGSVSIVQDCETGVGINISFEASNAYIVAQEIKRIDENGKDKDEFFPTSVAPKDSSETVFNANAYHTIKNPFNDYQDRKWSLEFSVPVVLPPNYILKDLLLSLKDKSNNVDVHSDLYKLKSGSPIQRADRLYSVSDLNQETLPSGATRVVKKLVLPISTIEKNVSWLKFDPNRKISIVDFEFKVLVNDGTKDIVEPVAASMSLTPLFNGIDNKYILCEKYSNKKLISMYGTYSTLKNLIAITSDPLFTRQSEVYCAGKTQSSVDANWPSGRRAEKRRNRIKCNDISLPFGGLFLPHNGETHRVGRGVDIAYPSCNPFDDINKNPSDRKTMSDNAFLTDETTDNSAKTAIQKWVIAVREGLNKIHGTLGENIEKLFITDNYGNIISHWQYPMLIDSQIKNADGDTRTISNSNPILVLLRAKIKSHPGHLDHIHLNFKE